MIISQKASTSYRFLVNSFTNSINIPLIPNVVALISVISLLINRTEMWGIFIAKFDPNNFEAFLEVVHNSLMNIYIKRKFILMSLTTKLTHFILAPFVIIRLGNIFWHYRNSSNSNFCIL